MNTKVEVRKPSCYPYPVKPTYNRNLAAAMEISTGVTANITWIDNYLNSVAMLATVVTTFKLYRTIDAGTTWTKICDEDSRHSIMTRNPDVNKSILRIKGGTKVYRSTDLTSFDPTAWDLVLETDCGEFNGNFGFSINDNVICLSAYGAKDAVNPPRKAWISFDYGGTWQLLFERQIADMPDPATYHIHDVCYDPYDQRVWIQEADTTNGKLLYSDDLGTTWVTYSDDQQATVLYAIPEGIVCGSDEGPNGIRLIQRDFFEQSNVPQENKLVACITPLTSALYGYAIKPRMETSHMVASAPYKLLMPFVPQYGGQPRLLASGDGVQWWEIWNPKDIYPAAITNTLVKICGPVSNDLTQRIYFEGSLNGSGNLSLAMKYPTWNKNV